jgi:O-acetyl-ADP-ribose deacetylase
MKAKVNRIAIEIVQNDIFALDVAGLVFTTDADLSVAPELLTKTGAQVQAECRQIGWCEVGSAIATNAGRLNVEKLIHVAGPQWGEGSERGKLANATWSVLNLAEENQLSSIAMPAISTGTLGYPLENCAITLLSQVIDFTFERVKHLKTIIICLDDELALEVFQKEFQRQIKELKETGEGKVSKVRA